MIGFIQPYLIPGFGPSYKKDMMTCIDGNATLNTYAAKRAKEKRQKTDADPILEEKVHALQTKMFTAAARMATGLCLLYFAFKVVEHVTRIVAQPIKFFDAPLMPMMHLAKWIVLYLAAHDLITISNKREAIPPEAPQSNVPQEPQEVESSEANGGYLQIPQSYITYGTSLFSSASTNVVKKPVEVIPPVNVEQPPNDPYLVINDTFLFPLWRYIMDQLEARKALADEKKADVEVDESPSEQKKQNKQNPPDNRNTRSRSTVTSPRVHPNKEKTTNFRRGSITTDPDFSV